MLYQTAETGASNSLSGWAIAGLVIALLAVLILVLIVLFNRPPPPPKSQIKGKGQIKSKDMNAGEAAPLDYGLTLLETPKAPLVGRPYADGAVYAAPVTTGADMIEEDAAAAAPKGRPLRTLDPSSSSSMSSESSSFSSFDDTSSLD